MANGVRLAVQEHGQGRHTVLLLGPLGAAGEAWVPFQVPDFTGAGYRVVTYNPRGVPPSEVPDPPYSVVQMAVDAAGVIEQVADEPVVLVGYSMGAFVAQELALTRSDLCRGVVLLGTLARKDVMRRALFDASLDMLRSRVELPASMRAVTSALQLYAPAMLDDDEWATTYLAAAMTTPPRDEPTRRGLLGQQEATTAYDDRLHELSGIAVPVLVVGFELDLLVPAKLTREVAGAVPDAKYVEIPGCGHGGPWEQPQAVNTVILEFLDGLATVQP